MPKNKVKKAQNGNFQLWNGRDLNHTQLGGIYPNSLFLSISHKNYYSPQVKKESTSGVREWLVSKSLIEMVKERTKEILKEHQPTPLDKDVQKEISNIIRRAESELAKHSS